MMRSEDRQTGFTLLELMIVIGIVGILSAIAIPAYHTYQIRARNAQTLSDLYHLNLFESEFYNEYHENVPVKVTDKKADGTISLPVTLADGRKVTFSTNGLSRDVQVAVRTSADKQNLVIGGVAAGSSDILAIDPDAGNVYHAISLKGSFSQSSLPTATAGDDLSAYPVYQK